MKITLDNYFEKFPELDLNSLPATLQEGHYMTESIYQMNDDWKYYHENKSFRETTDLYLEKLNEYIASQAKAAKVQAAPPAAREVQRTAKTKTTAIPKKKPAAKRKIKTEPKVDKVEAFSPEMTFIKRFIAMNGRNKTVNAVLAFLRTVQKAIVEKKIRKSSPLAKEINIIQDKLILVYHEMKGDEAAISINQADLGRMTAIAGGQKVYDSIRFIKRYIGMEGKQTEQKKRANLLKAIVSAETKGKLKDDPYLPNVQVIRRELEKGIQKELYVHRVGKTSLAGLEGIVKTCKCPKGLGRIYHTSGKTLQRCRKKTYSDSRGRGTCSHNKGLSGIMTASEVASLQFEMLPFSGPWLSLMGKPAKNFQMMIHGGPGSGKTTLMMLFIRYLSSLGNVLYVSSEEFMAATLTEKVRQYLNPQPPNIHFVADVRKVRLSDYDFVVLDSINDLRMYLEDFKELKRRNPDTAFILILQHTKDGQFRGSKDWEHEVEIAGKVDSGTISIYKNRYGTKGEWDFFNYAG